MAYTVAVSDGWVTGKNGEYIREAVKRECGHQHKSEAAAEACRQRLQKTTGNGPDRRTSAAWYDAIILCDGKSR